MRLQRTALCVLLVGSIHFFSPREGFSSESRPWPLQAKQSGSVPARAFGVAIYDPLGDRMIVFGGRDSHGLRPDTWALNLNGTLAWSQLPTTGAPPSDEVLSSAIYDPVRDRMLVWGGANLNLTIASFELYELNFNRHGQASTWSAVQQYGNEPAQRFAHSAIYDPIGDRMIVFGGQDGNTPPTIYGDTWELLLSGPPGRSYPFWSQLSSVGAPSARYGHTATYDASRQRMIVVGGYPPVLDGVHTEKLDILNLPSSGDPTWTDPLMGTYQDVEYRPAIYDPQFDRILMFGGILLHPINQNPCSDVYLYGLWMGKGTPPYDLSWSRYLPSYTAPGGDRWGSMAIFDPHPPNNRMILFGGLLDVTESLCTTTNSPPPYLDGVYSNDTYSLELGQYIGSSTWTLETSAAPAAGAPTSQTAGLSASRGLSVFPNPIKAKATIGFIAGRGEAVSVTIFDINGRRVKTLVVQASGGKNQVGWDARDQAGARVASGIYFVEARGERFSERKMAIVMR